MKVPIEGKTPGCRYGHSMEYIMPNLILYGGSGKTEIIQEVWMLRTDKTPFSWEKETIEGILPTARVYHTANKIHKFGKNDDMMVIFGGRSKDNKILDDLVCLKKNSSNKWEWNAISPKGYTFPYGRHQVPP